MTKDPDVHDLRPDMGTTRASLEKGTIFVIWLLSGLFLGIFLGVTGLYQSLIPVFSFLLFLFHILITYWIWCFVRRYRVIKFKDKRGDYEPAKEAASQAVSQAVKNAAEAASDAAETTGKLASGAIGLIQDAGETVAEKLEQRATQGKDRGPEAEGTDQSDITGRLEKLSSLHEQGHISDEEFAQQRSRILDEV